MQIYKPATKSWLYITVKLVLSYIIIGSVLLIANFWYDLPKWIEGRVSLYFFICVVLILLTDAFLAIRRVFTTRYVVYDEEIKIRSGKLFTIERIVPVKSIIHYSVSSSPLRRYFSIGKISLHTLHGNIVMDPLETVDSEAISNHIARVKTS